MPDSERYDANGERRPLARARIQRHEEAIELRDHHWSPFEPARKRIEEARKFISKETRAPVTTDFKLAGVDSKKFGAGLPQQMTTALRLRNFITSRVPELKWFPGQEGEGDEVATDLEQWGQAGMELIYPYVQLTDILQNEGEGGCIMKPDTRGWGKRPSPMSVKRDASGRGPKDRYYRQRPDEPFSPDLSKSSAAYQKDLMRHLAANFPVECEPLSLTEAAPINPRWVGSGKKAQVKIDGMIVERSFTVSELLRKGYCWWENGKLITPESSEGGGGTKLKLLEEWLTDEDELPWVTYTLTDGSKAFLTLREDRSGNRLVDAQIDLSATYGLQHLPVAWEYGWHWGVSDVGKRGIPFVFPFIEAFLTAMTMLSGISVHTLLTGFGGWFVLKDQATPRLQTDLVDINKPVDQPIRVGAFEVVELEARDVKPAVHAGATPQAASLIQFMLAQIAEAGPPPGAFGGSAENALDRTTMMRQTEMAVGDITGGTCRLYGRSASNLLAVGCAIGRKFDLPVPIAANVEVPNEGRNARSQTVLHPDDVGEIYDYTAVYPTKPGDNLALAAQLWGFYSGPKQGITFDEWREWAFGDNHPERAQALMAVEKLITTEPGYADIIDYAARKLADKDLAERIKAMQMGDLLPDGTITPMVAGVGETTTGTQADGAAGGGGGAGQQLASAGTAVADPGASQMASQVGAAIQQSRRVGALPGGPAPTIGG